MCRHLVQQLPRLKNYAARSLFVKAIGLVIQDALDLWAASGETLGLEYLTVEDLAASALATRVTRLQAVGHGRFAELDTVARAVHQAAQALFQLPGRLKEPVHQIMHGTFQDLRYVTAQLKAVDARIAREPLARSNRLLTVPGIGPVYGAGIVAEIPDITWFPDDDHLAQFAGLAWPAWQSGQCTATETPLARTGNGYLHQGSATRPSVRRVLCAQVPGSHPARPQACRGVDGPQTDALGLRSAAR